MTMETETILDFVPTKQFAIDNLHVDVCTIRIFIRVYVWCVCICEDTKRVNVHEMIDIQVKIATYTWYTHTHGREQMCVSNVYFYFNFIIFVIMNG